MTSIFVFILVSYSIVFLIADASIFGCGTIAYNENPSDNDYIWSQGILKIRPYFLHFYFFRELFSCYFCLGTWTGPLAHILLYYAIGKEKYWFYHADTQYQWLLACLLTSMISATGCYFVNILISKLESTTY